MAWATAEFSFEDRASLENWPRIASCFVIPEFFDFDMVLKVSCLIDLITS